MISQSIVDKVDMSQFYGKQQGSIGFDCILQFQEDTVSGKILTFKRNKKHVELTVLCEQPEIEYFIRPADCVWLNMLILSDGVEIFKMTDIVNNEMEVDIKYVQDVNCQVKLTIQK